MQDGPSTGKGCPSWPLVRQAAVASLEDPGKGFERTKVTNAETVPQ